MGWKAADAALAGDPMASGNVGAGTGVCAGKLLGPRCATKTGLGNAGITTPEGIRVAALAVVNPVGDVLRPDGSGILAGARTAPDAHRLLGTSDAIRAGSRCAPLHHNTTLCVLATNAELNKVEAAWLAEQGVAGLARILDPPFTRHDGDIVFAASLGGWTPPDREVALHRLAVLSRDVICAAIQDGCLSAKAAGGLPSCHDLKQPKHSGI